MRQETLPGVLAVSATSGQPFRPFLVYRPPPRAYVLLLMVPALSGLPGQTIHLGNLDSCSACSFCRFSCLLVALGYSGTSCAGTVLFWPFSQPYQVVVVVCMPSETFCRKDQEGHTLAACTWGNLRECEGKQVGSSWCLPDQCLPSPLLVVQAFDLLEMGEAPKKFKITFRLP